jgi:hypothetical protein
MQHAQISIDQAAASSCSSTIAERNCSNHLLLLNRATKTGFCSLLAESILKEAETLFFGYLKIDLAVTWRLLFL